MKKLIYLIGFLLIANLVFAAMPPVPMPVDGTVTSDGVLANGIPLTVTDKTNGEILTHNEVPSLLTQNGMYTFAMSDFSEFNYLGEVEIKACSLPSCIKTFTVDFDFPKKINFDISGGDIIYVCSDLSQVADLNDCPEPQPEIELKTVSNLAGDVVSTDVLFGQKIHIEVTNKKLLKLIDSDIDFDNDDYDVHEVIILDARLGTSLDDAEFGLDPYFIIPEDGIEYRYVFEDYLTLPDITEDEPLEINFLDEDIEIISATLDSITIISGKEYTDVKEGTEMDGFTVTSIETGYARISYNGESSTIYEGEVVSIGDLEFYVKEATGDDDVGDVATILVGEDIKEKIEDGDDYKGETWKWNIQLPDFIGISNQDDYEDIEDETKPLGLDDKIVLPNDFATIKFAELTTPTYYDLDIEIEDDMIRIQTDVNVLDDEYDDVLIYASGIYEDDTLLGTSLRIGDSDTFLEVGSAIIGKLKVLDLLADILYDGVSFSSKDADYLTYEGIIFRDPEDAVLDKDGFSVSVPEERPEVTITIGKDIDITPEGECPEEECPPNTCEDGVCPVCREGTPTPITCPEEKVCDVCEEGQDGIAAIIITGLIALVLGSSGMYYLKRGEIAVKGTGIKIYTNRNGVRVRQHRHPGIRGYHDTLTSHRVVKERHPKGQLDPLYERDDTGEWAYME